MDKLKGIVQKNNYKINLKNLCFNQDIILFLKLN